MTKLARLLFCTLGMAAAFGCGGGGGGSASGNDVLNTSYSPSPLAMTIYQHEPGAKVFLYANVSPLPAGNIYVLFEDPQQVLVPGTIAITNNGGGAFMAELPIDGSISEGVHQGNFNLHLCKDVNCASEYALSDPTIPYRVTVEPLMTATFMVDGNPVAATESFDATTGWRIYTGLTMHSGQTLRVSTSKVLDDSYQLGNGVTVTNVSKLPSAGAFSTWQAKLDALSQATEDIYLRQLSDGETVKLSVTVNP
jgi:hypothetical protein